MDITFVINNFGYVSFLFNMGVDSTFNTTNIIYCGLDIRFSIMYFILVLVNMFNLDWVIFSSFSTTGHY